jgi:hypothetical protein
MMGDYRFLIWFAAHQDYRDSGEDQQFGEVPNSTAATTAGGLDSKMRRP